GCLDAFVQGLDSVVLVHVDGALGHDRTGVNARVDDEQRAAGDLDAVLERFLGTVHAREGRRQRRVGVDGAPAELPQERLTGELHETGQDHQLGAVCRHLRGERGVPVRAGGEVGDTAYEGGDLGAARPGETLD